MLSAPVEFLHMMIKGEQKKQMKFKCSLFSPLTSFAVFFFQRLMIRNQAGTLGVSLKIHPKTCSFLEKQWPYFHFKEDRLFFFF